MKHFGIMCSLILSFALIIAGPGGCNQPKPTTIEINFNDTPGSDGKLGTVDDEITHRGDFLGNQYESIGVLFRLKDGTNPVIGSWKNTSHELPECVTEPYDLPKGFGFYPQNYQGGLNEAILQDVVIQFLVPVTEVSILAVDADEVVSMVAFDKDKQPIMTYTPDDCEYGDLHVIKLKALSENDGQFIDSILIDIVDGRTESDIGGPEMFDNMIFTSLQ
jgi:hypothetical protein